MVSHQRKWIEFFLNEKRDVHASLYKLFPKNLDWKINLLCKYNQVIEHISSITTERCFLQFRKKYRSKNFSFLLATQQLFSSFVQTVQQKFSTSSEPGGPQGTSQSSLTLLFSQLHPKCYLLGQDGKVKGDPNSLSVLLSNFLL